MQKLKNVLTIICIASVFSSCNTAFGPPKPPLIAKPRNLADSSWKNDTALYLIDISRNKIALEHASKQSEVATLSQFDSLVRINNGAMLNGKVVVRKDDQVLYIRLDSVFQILKANNITQFSLITDLEKEN